MSVSSVKSAVKSSISTTLRSLGEKLGLVSEVTEVEVATPVAPTVQEVRVQELARTINEIAKLSNEELPLITEIASREEQLAVAKRHLARQLQEIELCYCR
jgi:hypothetical protein